jgi:hypothetical protein
MTSLDPKALAELNRLIAIDPEKAREVFAKYPHLSQPLFQEIDKELLAQKVQAEDSPESFFAFCELLDGDQPPAHTKRQVQKIYEDHAKGTGTVNLAFRGSRKTTYFGVKFMAYRIGKEPHKTNVAIGANDDSPQKVAASVSVIIEAHPEWKRAFPSVVPDKDRGWSVEGYYVKDEAIPYAEWVKKQASTVDPTLVGGGYNSTRINGKHPTGILYIDDIHDINNNSDTQRKDVVKKLTTVILKTVIRVNDKLSTWVLGIGVPWSSDDGYQTMVNAGYGLVLTPAMRKAQGDIEGAVYLDGLNPATGVTYEDLQGWWRLTWPENFGPTAIIQERSFGKAEFWQMIMLDLATAATGKLVFHEIPAEQIEPRWPTLGGCDPTTFDETVNERKSSHFALGFVAKRPMGGLAVVDGVLEQCSMLAAENHILSAQTRFINWLFTAVENVGVGKVFIQSLRRNSLLRIVASGLKGISDARVRSKKDRFLVDVAPLLEDGTILLSNRDTPYLNAVRRLCNHFFDLSEHDPAWDAGDSLYHAIKAAPDSIQRNQIAAANARTHRMSINPLAGIGAHRGY